MASERTLSIIKPDGVKNGHIGDVIAIFESKGLRIAAMKMAHLTRKQAEGFYAEHSERPFFGELVEFMTSERVVLMVLEGEGAIGRNREIMGATDPAQADDGTIRKLYAESKGANTVHGSDSPASASREIAYFFGAAFEIN
ncbi:MAG TPA: nucleoside-diphosphate kinase [Myxococcales bacterium]|nr:nucleoside-diphosphate kinase [Myxococcales bacterium]